MTERSSDDRGAKPKATSGGSFGSRPTMMKPVKPPTQGPKGSAGDSGASKK
ncbi:MAG: hypothetical protein J0J05_12280 [Microbacterium sp.]|nr:hypothetical protein [Microbacterium sp.]